MRHRYGKESGGGGGWTHINTSWADSLPLVLPRTRTASKENIHGSVSEVVYSTTLLLPGEFNSSTHISTFPRHRKRFKLDRFSDLGGVVCGTGEPFREA